MAWLLLAVLVGCTVASVLAHEGAHVWMGLRMGWSYEGWFFKPKVLGLGVRLEANGNERHLWRVAAAGPLATLACMALFGLAEQVTTGQVQAIMHSMVAFNLFLIGVNLLPLRITDGALIVRGLVRKQ